MTGRLPFRCSLMQVQACLPNADVIIANRLRCHVAGISGRPCGNLANLEPIQIQKRHGGEPWRFWLNGRDYLQVDGGFIRGHLGMKRVCDLLRQENLRASVSVCIRCFHGQFRRSSRESAPRGIASGSSIRNARTKRSNSTSFTFQPPGQVTISRTSRALVAEKTGGEAPGKERREARIPFRQPDDRSRSEDVRSFGGLARTRAGGHVIAPLGRETVAAAPQSPCRAGRDCS